MTSTSAKQKMKNSYTKNPFLKNYRNLNRSHSIVDLIKGVIDQESLLAGKVILISFKFLLFLSIFK